MAPKKSNSSSPIKRKGKDSRPTAATESKESKDLHVDAVSGAQQDHDDIDTYQEPVLICDRSLMNVPDSYNEL